MKIYDLHVFFEVLTSFWGIQQEKSHTTFFLPLTENLLQLATRMF